MTPYELAQKFVGLKEWAEGSNPEIEKMFADAGHSGNRDDVPWCAAFVGAMLKRAGIKGTGKLNARSYLDWGVPVDRKDAKPGDIVVFKRGNSSWQGHVAFFVKDRGALIDVLGGNQSNAVNIKGYQAAALLGIRRASDKVVKLTAVAKKPAQAPKPVTASPVTETAKDPQGTDPRAVGRILGGFGTLIALTSETGREFLAWVASWFQSVPPMC